eukprot:6724255-Alexandrium_andersonii.AAC.1
MIALKPYAAKGEEWRAVVENYSEFYARSAVDWERPTAHMREALGGPDGLPAEARWESRARHAC